MKNNIDIRQLPDRIVLLNLYLSQFVLFAIGYVIMHFLQRRSWVDMPNFAEPFTWDALWWGGGLAAIVLLIDTFIPSALFDDGGTNEKLFARRPVWHITIICAIVSISEEFLFRGVIQYSFGVFWTSILFMLLHWRYLHRWYLAGYVFLISVGLGFIYVQSGTIWASIAAHFIIDFCLACFIRWKGGTSKL